MIPTEHNLWTERERWFGFVLFVLDWYCIWKRADFFLIFPHNEKPVALLVVGLGVASVEERSSSSSSRQKYRLIVNCVIVNDEIRHFLRHVVFDREIVFHILCGWRGVAWLFGKKKKIGDGWPTWRKNSSSPGGQHVDFDERQQT